MIKLFRNIRQNLVTQDKSVNRTTNYFKYAIGEIVLVVIGILIALQINNWNEQRKDRIQEKNFLSRLEIEIMIDIENISNSINRYC